MKGRHVRKNGIKRVYIRSIPEKSWVLIKFSLSFYELSKLTRVFAFRSPIFLLLRLTFFFIKMFDLGLMKNLSSNLIKSSSGAISKALKINRKICVPGYYSSAIVSSLLFFPPKWIPLIWRIMFQICSTCWSPWPKMGHPMAPRWLPKEVSRA